MYRLLVSEISEKPLSHLLENMKHTVIITPTNQYIADALLSQGINIIPTHRIAELRDNEQFHADMQICIIRDTAFIPENCHRTVIKAKEFGYNIKFCKQLSAKYPQNILLNVALIGNKLFCKEADVATEIKEYCTEHNIEIINVNQGYTKCSTLVLSDKAIITADPSISKAAAEQGIEVLRITPGYIVLDDADYGFIGGASGVIGDTVYFFGDIHTHPDHREILCFLTKHNMKYFSLYSGPMNDIGGFVYLGKTE